MPPLLTIIIPVRNDLDGLRKCLACLTRQATPVDAIETIVIDNGSDRPIAESVGTVRNLSILLEPRPGSYAARNKGLAAAKGRIIAFTDADCLPREDWVSSGVSAIETLAGPGAIGGRIDVVTRDGRRPRAVELYEKAFALAQEDFVNERGFAATANMWTTQDTFGAIGPFDATLLSGGDVEWGRRLRAGGLPLVYDDSIVVEHPARQTWAEIYRKLRRVRSSPYGKGLRHGAGVLHTAHRGYGTRLARFIERTKGWPLGDRGAALMVAAAAELALPIVDLELRLRKWDRL